MLKSFLHITLLLSLSLAVDCAYLSSSPWSFFLLLIIDLFLFFLRNGLRFSIRYFSFQTSNFTSIFSTINLHHLTTQVKQSLSELHVLMLIVTIFGDCYGNGGSSHNFRFASDGPCNLQQHHQSPHTPSVCTPWPKIKSIKPPSPPPQHHRTAKTSQPATTASQPTAPRQQL
jgi:hypothetical protein